MIYLEDVMIGFKVREVVLLVVKGSWIFFYIISVVYNGW